MKKIDFDEFAIYEKIKQTLIREMDNLYKKTAFATPHDFAALEKLTKIYAILKDDLREDVKYDLYKKLGLSAD